MGKIKLTRKHEGACPSYSGREKEYYLQEVQDGSDQYGNVTYEYRLMAIRHPNNKIKFNNVVDLYRHLMGEKNIKDYDTEEDVQRRLLYNTVRGWESSTVSILRVDGKTWKYNAKENSIEEFYFPEVVLPAYPYSEAVKNAIEYIEEQESEVSLF